MRSSRQREYVFFLLCAVFSLYIVWPLVVPMAAGMALAYVCEHPLDWILAKVKPKRSVWRWVWAFVLIIAILALFLVPMTLFVVTTLRQAAGIFDPEVNPVFKPGMIRRGAEWLSGKAGEVGVTISIPEINAQMRNAVVKVSESAADWLRNIVSGTPASILATFLLLMAWGLFLVEGKALRARFLPKFIPWDEERKLICDTTGDVLKAVILANVAVSVVQAIVVAGFLGFTGVPNWLLWSGLAFFLSFIPLLGTAPIMVGAAIYCFIGDRVVAGVVLGVGSVIVGAIDNVLRPFFVKGRAALSFFWVFVAFVGGIAQFGIAGTVLGPLAFALFTAAARTYERGRDPRILVPEGIDATADTNVTDA